MARHTAARREGAWDPRPRNEDADAKKAAHVKNCVETLDALRIPVIPRNRDEDDEATYQKRIETAAALRFAPRMRKLAAECASAAMEFCGSGSEPSAICDQPRNCPVVRRLEAYKTHKFTADSPNPELPDDLGPLVCPIVEYVLNTTCEMFIGPSHHSSTTPGERVLIIDVGLNAISEFVLGKPIHVNTE